MIICNLFYYNFIHDYSNTRDISQVAVAGMALPWAGFGFGAAAGLVCRRPWQEVMTIAIESGIQNTGLAITIIKVTTHSSLPSPIPRFLFVKFL